MRLVQDHEVSRLRMSMEINGYLPIDRVIVRKLAERKYVVLEGNRRICAAKMIDSVTLEGASISAGVRDSLKQIPCLLYVGEEEDAAWIFQGIRHITGICEWDPYNKARLLVEQMEEGDLSLTDVGKRFGLTPHGAGQWVRGYKAYLQATTTSDYTECVDQRSYTYFQELFSRSSAPVREWMEWDDSKYAFGSAINLNEFVSWLYPRDSDAEESGKPGNWDNRIIKTREHVRQIAELIAEAPDLFQRFRQNRDIDDAYSAMVAKRYEDAARKKYDPVSQVFEAVATCIKAMDNVPMRVLNDPAIKTDLIRDIGKLKCSAENLLGTLNGDAK